MKHILAIDQGTTSTRAILFDETMQIAHVAQREFTQHFPAPGYVEHEPDDLWNTTIETCKSVVSRLDNGARDIAAIGITNQRETTLVWDARSGKPVHRAIVWQDRRTAGMCEELKAKGLEKLISARTGLLADPYFSATKIRWILENVDGAGALAKQGRLRFGTVDSFLIWKLTGGTIHATDATNAARTMLYDISKGTWDEEILAALEIPHSMLPEIMDCAAHFGDTEAALFGRPIPILGVAGDQQAATMGQACFQPGMMKSTYGTGCFALLNTGPDMIHSKNRLLTTIAYQLGGKRTFALEGSIFVAGAVVQWLRDGLEIIKTASQTQQLAEKADPAQMVYLVPAFTGLGAPYWDAQARGAIFGLTRGTGPAELARAALESVGYQTRDLLEAMQADWGTRTEGTMRVDGGMAASDWAMQFLADITNAPVDRPAILETTATGAAWLAGMQAGLYPEMDEFSRSWAAEHRFTPTMGETERERKYAGWKDAVRRTLSHTG